ncbi:MAG: hypothetical protein WC718_16340 [Phycisphaerales bacterium]|jgi:hypothetical protein
MKPEVIMDVTNRVNVYVRFDADTLINYGRYSHDSKAQQRIGALTRVIEAAYEAGKAAEREAWKTGQRTCETCKNHGLEHVKAGDCDGCGLVFFPHWESDDAAAIRAGGGR